MRWIVGIVSKKRRNVRWKGSIEDLYHEISNCQNGGCEIEDISWGMANRIVSFVSSFIPIYFGEGGDVGFWSRFGLRIVSGSHRCSPLQNLEAARVLI